jgi:hypothetical protein
MHHRAACYFYSVVSTKSFDMRFCPIAFLVGYTLSVTSALAQTKTEQCMATCGFAPLYSVDTLRVVDLPERRKTIRIPEVYEVTIDSVIDESGSKIRRYPPTYEVTYNRDGSENIKVIGNGDQVFFLDKTVVAVERKTVVIPADIAMVDLPPTYITVYEKRLAAQQPEPIEVEVLCPERVTKELVARVRAKLNDNGFAAGPETGQADGTLMDALQRYQAANRLPLCGFNLITLDALGVRY